MSGRKEHNVTVDLNALRLQRELEQARSEAEVMAREVASLRAAARAMHCPDVPIPEIDRTNLARIKAYLAEARKAADEIKRAMARERFYRAAARLDHDEAFQATARQRALAAELGLPAGPEPSPLGGDASSAEIREATARLKSQGGGLERRISIERSSRETMVDINEQVRPPASDDGEAIRQVSDKARTLLTQVDPDVSEAELTEIEKTVAEIGEASGREQAIAILATLHSRVDRANGAAAASREARDEALSLRDTLRGLSGPEIDRVRSELDRVAEGKQPLSPALRERVGAAREMASQAVDTDYIGQAARASLAELGIKVSEEEFSTGFSGGRIVEIPVPPSEGSSLRMQYDAGQRRMITTPSREDGGAVDPAADDAACGLVKRFNETMVKHGIDIVTVNRWPLPPGNGQAAPAARKNESSRRPQSRQREL